uniref:Uncharacterized protein n=1 Tax=Myripristis murdjan TaxID=586833 RepID=A0A667Z1U3_9TELE
MERKMSTMTCSDFNELCVEGKLCGVVIRVTVGKVPNLTRVYNILGVSPDMMRLIIEYDYTHSAPETEEDVVKLLEAAGHFSMISIIQACCKFLEEQLCPGEIWTLCTDLRCEAQLFILHHFEELLFVLHDFEEPLFVLHHFEDLNTKQESSVFEIHICWIAHLPEKQKHKGYISVLLPEVTEGWTVSQLWLPPVYTHIFGS